MNIEMIDEYMNLCANLCNKPEDYTKKNVAKNNKTMIELLSLAAKISNDEKTADIIFGTLLENDDINVRVCAASHCLKYGFHINKAEKTLEQIAIGTDKIRAFGAEMTLKVWRGEIPGKTL